MEQQQEQARKQAQEVVDKSHNSFYDRGGADFYYRRHYSPHMRLSDLGPKLPATTSSEEAAYKQGWDDAEVLGDQKDYI